MALGLLTEAKGTMVPLGWELLGRLRRGLLTRPMVYDGKLYPTLTDGWAV